MLFVAAIVLGLAGLLLAVAGVTRGDPPLVLQLVGSVLALAGFTATLAGGGPRRVAEGGEGHGSEGRAAPGAQKRMVRRAGSNSARS